MAASTQLARFRDAMQNVYGSFEDVSAKDLDGWDPPPKSGGHRGRYLWTDAFGVLNFLTLHKETVERKYLAFAESLVKTVHNVLGYARDGRNRLPGATEENPLGGGLRIGKEEATGPDGDGQYHHYLTLWMFALNRLSVATGNPQFNTQAVSLAKAIHPRFFIDRTSPRPRMVWKTAMDMSKPLVASEGNLDPIDGHVIFRLLQSAADKGEILQEEIDDYKRVMDRKGQHFVSNDTLDLGMTLWTSHWLSEREPWANRLAGRCVKQLHDLFEEEYYLERNLRYRLAFREFGTCLGIGCYERAGSLQDRKAEIVSSWEAYLETQTPEDLRPISQVMYAAAILPGAFTKGYFGAEHVL